MQQDRSRHIVCREDGSFAAVQCMGPRCFCVDTQTGKRINSETFPMMERDSINCTACEERGREAKKEEGGVRDETGGRREGRTEGREGGEGEGRERAGGMRKGRERGGEGGGGRKVEKEGGREGQMKERGREVLLQYLIFFLVSQCPTMRCVKICRNGYRLDNNKCQLCECNG